VKISFYTKSQPGKPQENWTKDTFYGYGKSYVEIKKAFERYQYRGRPLEVLWNDPGCNAQVYFGFIPEEGSHYEHQYKIFMSHTESSLMPESRASGFLKADELWTGNDWGREAAIKAGLNPKKVFVYNLGIKPELYVPTIRGRKGKIRFLHIGAGWVRKRSDLVIEAFNILYKKYGDLIELTVKDVDEGAKTSIHNWLQDFVLKNAGEKISPGIRKIEETLSEQEMISLINFHDVLVYPSEGEGFGLIPLEAMASGMPVISTHEWCSYSDFLIDTAIDSEIKTSDSHWGYDMDGKVVVAQLESIVEQMENVIKNMESVSLKYFNQAPEILEQYSWDRVTKNFLDSRIPNIGVSKFK
jgi:glycosyltransferase involved in cell wall biosynthesis